MDKSKENDSSLNIKTKVKIIFLGDSSVGKSSIISTLRSQTFHNQHQPTVGIDFFSKTLISHNHQYKLQFWDTAGQQRFRSIIPSYIRNSQIGVIVYDVGNRSTFENIDLWVEVFKQYSAYGSSLILVGNKIDLINKKVTTDEAYLKAQSYSLNFIQVSAKTSQGINRFDSIILEILQNIKYEEPKPLKTHTISYNRQDSLYDKAKSDKKWYKQCCFI